MKLKCLSARKLLSFSTSQLWDMLTGSFYIRFDDGEEILTNHRETLYSSYFWDFHRKYPKTPLLKHHHVSHVLKGKDLTSKTHIELVGLVYWDVVDTYELITPSMRDSVTRMIYEITNTLYVDLSHRAESSVVSIDVLDFIQIIDNPDVKESLLRVEREAEIKDGDYGRAAIDAAYKKTLEVLEKSSDLENNAVARAVRAKMVNANQVLQCVNPRGFLTDVDGVVIPVPVTRSYTTGMRTLYNGMVESRSAAKSLYFSESPLQDSEYFARRLQLQCMIVERLHYVDCGSTEYFAWRVKPPKVVGDRTVYPGDLRFLVGKYYHDEVSGKLLEIRENDTHLYNKTIQLRSVLTCKHPDHHGVCAVCFGKLSDNLTSDVNLGHYCAAMMTQQTSQSVLSTKHLDASSSSEPIVLSEMGKRYFSVSKNGNGYLVNRDFKDQFFQIMISQDEVYGLTDILLLNSIDDVNPSRISEIESVTIVTKDKQGTLFKIPITVSQNGRMAMLTPDFLDFLKNHRWEQDNKGNFIFKFDNWDFNKPMMLLPEMEYSFSYHSHQVAEIIESRMKEIGDRMRPESPFSTLIELFDLVNAKLNVNLALLEVILYANMIRHGENDDFGLARNSPYATLGVSDMTLRRRSMSAAYAYEKQLVYITDPFSFYKANRPDSVFDCFIAPKEVVEAYKQR